MTQRDSEGRDHSLSPGSVLVIGEDARGGLASSLVHAFADLGWGVTYVPWGPWWPVTLSRLAFRSAAFAEPFRRRLRIQVKAAARDRAFSLVIVVKGPFMDAKTISDVRTTAAAPVACWNGDDPFDSSRSNSRGGLADAVQWYDTYVTWADDVAERIRLRNRRVLVIPFGFDPYVHFEEPGSGIAYDRLVFVGTWTPDRHHWLQRLAPWEPMVFGNDWPTGHGLDVQAPVFEHDFRGVIGEARWNLNLLRPQNRRSHNMRTFEIPGCGGRQLAQASPDHMRYFASPSTTVFEDFDALTALLESAPADEAGQLVGGRDAHSYKSRAAMLVHSLERDQW